MASAFVTLPKPFLYRTNAFSSTEQRLTGLRKNSLKINAIAKKWEPTKVVPQADRVLIRLEELAEKTAGGVLLPKSAVKFERYLTGEILSVGAEVREVGAGKKDIVSHEGVGVDLEKIDAVKQWPSPTTIKELRDVLGLTGYYRRFVQNYGVIAKPLIDLTRKDAFRWNDRAEIAFQKLKDALTTVFFSDINAYEVDLGTDAKHCFCKASDLLAVVE